ncbi:putative DNA binding domain-containing protein [Flavivirga aquimarina]|uniref:DNA binding domain-containing protein n=1 Tax=Flavivirga aquimarina TaxID=2027862 RepID=A0ABT8WAX9_9FLAO|nr:RNA-binding domain-containing protein [Flavivirga aquimarina]MDO5970289.1 putative DNA binding domain-containing protein [Flavivirga aquimarina]
MTESNRIEYKRELNDKLEKEAIAFLNDKGGVIYLGVDDDGRVVGLDNSDDVQLKVKDRLKTNIEPSCMGLFDIEHEAMDDKDVVKVTLASGTENPYYWKKYGMTEKGAYIRVGSASEPMPQKMIEDLFSKRTRNSIGKIKSPRQNLTFEQLKIYYEASGYRLTDQFATNLELLTENGEFNYVAYLMADENGMSIQVAKYSGTNRVNLIENNEYGYESLIKATKSVLDKLDLENRTRTKITPKERENTRLWNAIAIREAVINAIVHNDYSREASPKFEIFSDRLEITSVGGLSNGLDEDEFFKGYSIPVNKELMRIYKDLDMVERLGSGMPRILEAYPKECFTFSNNFLRMSFPATEQVTQLIPQDAPPHAPQVIHITPQVEKLLQVISGEMSRGEIQKKLGLSDKKNYIRNYQKPALEGDIIEMTIPDKPNSRLQKYRLTEFGKKLKEEQE